MSIDRIGKPGAPPLGPSGALVPSGQSFEVGSVSDAAPAALSGLGSDALSALERGEISVEQYLNAQVENAVAPLASTLSPEQLDFVRQELRAGLETDPVLLELVRKTTGAVASNG